MSGRKIVYITDQELDRQLKHQREQLQHQFQAEKNKTVNELSERISKELFSNQRMNNAKFSALDEAFKESERIHTRRIDELKRQAKNDKQELMKLIAYESEQLNDRINLINKKLSEKYSQESQIANQWLHYLDYIIDELQTNFNANRFKPNELNKLISIREIVKDNIQNSVFQASLAMSQTSIAEASVLKIDLELLNNQFDSLFKEVSTNIELAKRIVDNQHTIMLDFNTDMGIVQKVPVLISKWAESEWDLFIGNYNTIKNQLDDHDSLTIQDLEQMKQISSAFDELYLKTAEKACKKYYQHIYAMDKQEEIANKLSDMGFEVIENFHEAEDERGKNILIVENSSHEKIKVSIAVDANDSKGIKTELDFSTLNEVMHRERLKNILEVLNTKESHEVPGYEHQPAEPIEFDVQRLKQRRQQH